MYKPICLGHKGFFVAIAILAAIFITIYGNYAYAFKSEEELIDETRQAIEKHLNEVKELSADIKKIAERKPPEAETPAVIAEEAKEKELVLAKQEPPVEKKSAEPETPAEPEAPAKPETPAEPEAPPEPVSPDVQPITTIIDNEGNPQPAGTEIDYSAKGKGIYIKPAMEEPVLKKMDVNRIGASPYYETYEGLRLLKYFTVAQRVEIYQEPRPVDSYIMDAFAMRYLYGIPWNIKSDYRTQITPLFTRAYGTEITMSDPKNKAGQLRYTHDYREIYKNYWPKYQYTNVDPANDINVSTHLEKEMWDQNEVMWLYANQIQPLDWNFTANAGYRYSTMSAKSDTSYYEIRHTYLGAFSIAPTDKIEYFFQGEYYKSMHIKADYDYRPDHFLGRTEIRIKSNDMKTIFVPQFSYSKDLYYPFPDTFEKYEIALRVGRDWTNKFKTTHTLQYTYDFRSEPSNKFPNHFAAGALPNAHKDKAECISLENRFQYNVYDRLWIQTGLDIANGINWSIFDNFGLLGGLEYYAPGMIRVDVGWRGNYYYNLADFMSSVYFKFYLFM